MHQGGSSLGAWGGGLIFTAYGNYDYAWKTGVLIGFSAGVLQILAGADPETRPARRTTAGHRMALVGPLLVKYVP